MNNSFPRLIDGMCATLRDEVLTRLDDEFARGQVFGVINLLNTFRSRADWSTGFLLQQLAAQRQALDATADLLRDLPSVESAPPVTRLTVPEAVPSADLLALRDRGNAAICALLGWLDREAARLEPSLAAAVEAELRRAMRAEVEIELKNSPRPLFAEMSSGREN